MTKLVLEHKQVLFSGPYYVAFRIGGTAPVHIITGSAGCQEGRDKFRNNPLSWSAFRSQDYGFTRFKAYNKTHINMEQVSADLNGEVIDSFWLIKDKFLRFQKI